MTIKSTPRPNACEHRQRARHCSWQQIKVQSWFQIQCFAGSDRHILFCHSLLPHSLVPQLAHVFCRSTAAQCNSAQSWVSGVAQIGHTNWTLYRKQSPICMFPWESPHWQTVWTHTSIFYVWSTTALKLQNTLTNPNIHLFFSRKTKPKSKITKTTKRCYNNK